MIEHDRFEAEEATRLGELLDAHDDMLAGLRNARRAAALTVEELAERLQWPVQAVIDFETGYSDPHLSTVRRYAIAVGAAIRHRLRPWEPHTPDVPGAPAEPASQGG